MRCYFRSYSSSPRCKKKKKKKGTGGGPLQPVSHKASVELTQIKICCLTEITQWLFDCNHDLLVVECAEWMQLISLSLFCSAFGKYKMYATNTRAAGTWGDSWTPVVFVSRLRVLSLPTPSLPVVLTALVLPSPPKAIFFGGIDPSIRGEVWPFLLHYYSYDSTSQERETWRLQKRGHYHDIQQRRWGTYVPNICHKTKTNVVNTIYRKS